MQFNCLPDDDFLFAVCESKEHTKKEFGTERIGQKEKRNTFRTIIETLGHI